MSVSPCSFKGAKRVGFVRTSYHRSPHALSLDIMMVKLRNTHLLFSAASGPYRMELERSFNCK